MSNEVYANASSYTLSVQAGAADNTLTLNSAPGPDIPNPGTGRTGVGILFQVSAGVEINREIVYYSGVSTNVVTLTLRAAERVDGDQIARVHPIGTYFMPRLTAAVLNNVINQFITSYDALRSIQSPADGQRAMLAGAHIAGAVEFDSSLSDADDDGYYFAPTDATPGRWRRTERVRITANWWMEGITDTSNVDCQPAFQAARQIIVNMPNQATNIFNTPANVLHAYPGDYRLNDTLFLGLDRATEPGHRLKVIDMPGVRLVSWVTGKFAIEFTGGRYTRITPGLSLKGHTTNTPSYGVVLARDTYMGVTYSVGDMYIDNLEIYGNFSVAAYCNYAAESVVLNNPDFSNDAGVCSSIWMAGNAYFTISSSNTTMATGQQSAYLDEIYGGKFRYKRTTSLPADACCCIAIGVTNLAWNDGFMLFDDTVSAAKSIPYIRLLRDLQESLDNPSFRGNGCRNVRIINTLLHSAAGGGVYFSKDAFAQSLVYKPRRTQNTPDLTQAAQASELVFNANQTGGHRLDRCEIYAEDIAIPAGVPVYNTKIEVKTSCNLAATTMRGVDITYHSLTVPSDDAKGPFTITTSGLTGTVRDADTETLTRYQSGSPV